MKFLQNTIIFAIFFLSVVSARMLFDSDRQDMEPAGADSIFTPYVAQPYDQQAAATGGHEHGRVQIKVYRGPDTHGDHHEHFAPHGFWVKQPADDDHHH